VIAYFEKPKISGNKMLNEIFELKKNEERKK
jgi:hypothetical protein